MRGSGTYTVTFSADVTTAGLLIGNDIVTFDLGGKTYRTTASNNIGAALSQTGKLTIKNGTLGVDTAGDKISVGAASSVGFLTVSTGGRLGNGTLDPELVIGSAGTGTLMIEDNGRVDVGILNLGQDATANGTATISGPNAVLDGSGLLYVGKSGTGTLNIQNGGSLSTAGSVEVGTFLGANGTVKINGLDSVWTQSVALYVGDLGDGAITIEAAGLMETGGPVSIGTETTGVGTVVVTGTDSTWNSSNSMQIGAKGLGNVLILSGGKANTSGASTVGAAAGSEGNIVVSGAGSKWSTSSIALGSAGSGNLTVNQGGVVNSGGGVSLGAAATGAGKATVSGAGSAWNITGDLSIAAQGAGTLTVDTDASLAATGALTIGDPAGAPVGSLNFNGGTITAGSFTRVGASTFNWTDGTLLVNGGAMNNGGASLVINGSALDDLPALRLSGGANSTIANLPNLTIGSNRQGAVIVSGGSNFQTTTAAIGSADGGNGSLHVEGLGSTFSTNGDLGVGGTTTSAGGLGGITLGPGGTVTAQGTLRLWGGGTINIAAARSNSTPSPPTEARQSFLPAPSKSLPSFNANDAALDALIGPAHTLGLGRKIETPNNTMNLQSNLTVVRWCRCRQHSDACRRCRRALR